VAIELAIIDDGQNPGNMYC